LGNIKPYYVIYAGSGTEHEETDTRHLISYNDHRAALVLCKSAISLSCRDKVIDLEKGTIHLISADRPATLRKKTLLAASFLVAACAIGSVLWPGGASEQLLPAGSEGSEAANSASSAPGTLPPEYYDLNFEIPERMPYASKQDAKTDDNEYLQEHVKKLLATGSENGYKHNEDYIPFCIAVIEDSRLGPEIRFMAFKQLMNIANNLDKPEIVDRYKRLPDDDPVLRAKIDSWFNQ